MEKTPHETLEEAAYQDCKKSGFSNTSYASHCLQSFVNGAKWQAERMYSEEEVKRIAFSAMDYKNEKVITLSEKRKWFEQHKK